MEEHEAPWLENGRRFRHLPRVVQLSARHHDVRAVPLADGAHAIEARLIVEPFAVDVTRNPSSRRTVKPIRRASYGLAK